MISQRQKHIDITPSIKTVDQKNPKIPEFLNFTVVFIDFFFIKYYYFRHISIYINCLKDV